MRGRALQLGEAVSLDPPQDGELLRATVAAQPPATDEDEPQPDIIDEPDDDNDVPQENAETTHQVVIRPDNDAAIAECTCETFGNGAYCSHIWAALLHLQDSRDTRDPLVRDLTNRRVRPPRARKRAAAAKPRSTEWANRMSQLRPPTIEPQETGSAASMLGQVWYAVLGELSGRYNALFIELREGTGMTTASIGSGGSRRLKTLKLSNSSLLELVDETDRELCATLVGAVGIADPESDRLPTSDRGHAVYRIPTGARYRLLSRMIATGRCVLDTQDGGDGALHPIYAWNDEPWRLWVRGDEQEEDLRVIVDFRRNHRRLQACDPPLVLGGPEGLLLHDGEVAPLRDQGAFRWVSQCRSHLGPGAEARPLMIPQPDVPKFVERLYRLPFLPEIDLPDQYGPDEVVIEPVPVLQVGSNGSSGSAQDSGDSGSKNTLLARAFMAYGDEWVNPAQPGRYVSLNGASNPLDATAANEAGPATEAESTDEPTQAEAPESPDDSTPAPEPTSHRLIRRQPDAEQQALRKLAAIGLTRQPNAGGNSFTLPANAFAATVRNLSMDGWRVTADQKAIVRADTPAVSIASGIDWFELRGAVKYERNDGEAQEVGLPQILQAIREGRQTIQLDDGSQGLLPEQWLEEQGLLSAIGEIHGDDVRFQRTHLAMLDALLEQTQVVEMDETFQVMRDRLHRFEGIEPIAAHDTFEGDLRQYQQEGLGWLAFLQWFGMGGILADDMGLGKTIQVLASLQRHYHDALTPPAPAVAETQAAQPTQPEHRPSMVVAPKSVIFNWVDEATRFTPDLRVLSYTGSDRHDSRETFADQDLIVTSYGLLRRDIEALREHPFEYVILDEAQAIKNPASQSAKAARLVNARYRLALTGTPVENHLGDLWSIFEFLNPGILGSHLQFSEMLKASNLNTNQNGVNQAARSRLLQQVARMLRPFILRRTKQQVLSDLPEKTEQTLLCDMEPAQQQVYDELREYYRQTLTTQLDQTGASSGVGSASFMVLEALLRLRQAACHPGLIDPARRDESSAKLDTLFEMLDEIMEEDGKALVFSQFTSMLSIVKEHLEARGIRYLYLDGQTRNRKQIVEQFQNDDSVPVFLISLKAGGFGLNLTAAEYVFILDPWWNPAVEAQAIDRVHRIGQTRPVFAYRLVCSNTVEQRILSLQARKRELAEAIVDGQQTSLKDLTREDIEQLLS